MQQKQYNSKLDIFSNQDKQIINSLFKYCFSGQFSKNIENKLNIEK